MIWELIEQVIGGSKENCATALGRFLLTLYSLGWVCLIFLEMYPHWCLLLALAHQMGLSIPHTPDLIYCQRLTWRTIHHEIALKHTTNINISSIINVPQIYSVGFGSPWRFWSGVQRQPTTSKAQVAVKRISHESLQLMKEFMAEVVTS